MTVGGHWLDVDGRPLCDPTAEPARTDGLSPWQPAGPPCQHCAGLVAEFRRMADRCGFGLRPRHRYPAGRRAARL